jgi:hypothetical protein
MAMWEKVQIALPGRGRAAIDFAIDVGKALRLATDRKFRRFCVRHGLVGEIKEYQKSGTLHLAFVPLTPAVAVTELEEIIHFVANHGVTQSMTVALTKVLLASRQLKELLPRVDRILHFSIPAAYKRQRKDATSTDFTASVTFVPVGFCSLRDSLGHLVHYYCHEDQTHFVALSAQTKWWSLARKDVRARRHRLNLAITDEERLGIREAYRQRMIARKAAFVANQDAYRILIELLEEFELGKTAQIHALARLITPYCQAMIGWLKRTPCWLFSAEGPRSGKDFLAKLTPILYEGIASEDAPLDQDDAEVKRRITASVVAGTRFMHFANCKGALASPSLEGAITAEYWSDRVVGTSTVVNMPIEIIFSLSYNDRDITGFSEDLELRGREINITMPLGAPVNPNKRVFDRLNLHDELRNPKYRRVVLAAIYALVENWRKAGCPPGPTFTSFPEWAHVVGGILQVGGLGDATTSSRRGATSPTGVSTLRIELLALLDFLADNHNSKSLTFPEIHDIIRSNATTFPLLSSAEASRVKQPLGRFLSQMLELSDKSTPNKTGVAWVNLSARRKQWKFWRNRGSLRSELIDI